MLEQSFVHLSGVGERAEQRLWQAGCTHWDEFLSPSRKYSVGSASKTLVREELLQSKEMLAAQNHQFFRKRLRLKHAWRAFEAFRDSCLYIDIETDGGWGEDSVTIIGVYDGKQFKAFVKHDDLATFRDLISHYSMIVTFFGTGFDIPVLERAFVGASLDQIHIDLCPLFRTLNVRGGLKKIEEQFGIRRSEATLGLNGRDAIYLWQRHLRGSESALETLIAYNREDTVNMERLAEIAVGAAWRVAHGAPIQYALDEARLGEPYHFAASTGRLL